MKIEKFAKLNVSADRAWQLLGPDYVRAADWASAVFVSSARPGTPEIARAPVAGRVCETSLGPFTETIVEYDPSTRRIAYRATGEKMPGFMRSLVNTWKIQPTGDSTCDVTMILQAELAPPFNVLMAPLIRLQFSGVLNRSLEEFAHFAETGNPHPRKVKTDRSSKASAARSRAAAA
ncbi:MAG: SRPBCC family protein [Myxococcota bacterium]